MLRETPMKPTRNAPSSLTSTVAVSSKEGAVMATSLNALTQASVMLASSYKHFHWTVAGPHFAPLHALYDTHAALIAVHVDDLAERIIQLGGVPMALPGEVAAKSPLKAPESGVVAWRAQLAWLDAAHVAVIRHLTEAIADATDPGVADLLTRVVQDHQKMAWMIRASAHGA